MTSGMAQAALRMSCKEAARSRCIVLRPEVLSYCRANNQQTFNTVFSANDRNHVLLFVNRDDHGQMPPMVTLAKDRVYHQWSRHVKITLAITWPQSVKGNEFTCQVAAKVDRDVRHPQSKRVITRITNILSPYGKPETTSLSRSGSFVIPSSSTDAPASFNASRRSSPVMSDNGLVRNPLSVSVSPTNRLSSL